MCKVGNNTNTMLMCSICALTARNIPVPVLRLAASVGFVCLLLTPTAELIAPSSLVLEKRGFRWEDAFFRFI